MENDSLEITCNGQRRYVPAGTTISALLAELGLAPRQVAVEVNFTLVPRGRHDQYHLSTGDQLEVVTLVGGG